ncbi:hypothetical protein ABZT17_31570 [Streptomyces sp. NPDC005648]|uniref:hypothetical protein n=1 Tax=Streptomyces sp. NPDC005648 TaxID=3157044 RepID=UPI0033ABDBFA
MVNVLPAAAHRIDEFSAQAAHGAGRHLTIEDLDASGQSDAVMFCICIVAVPADGRGGQLAA